MIVSTKARTKKQLTRRRCELAFATLFAGAALPQERATRAQLFDGAVTRLVAESTSTETATTEDRPAPADPAADEAKAPEDAPDRAERPTAPASADTAQAPEWSLRSST
jgi:hypothetical protein